MEERTGAFLDERLMRLSATIPSLEHFERNDYLDKMEMMRNEAGAAWQRHRRWSPTQRAADQLCLRTLILLATVHPAAPAVMVFGIPLIAAGITNRKWLLDFEEVAAENNRRARHLFRLGTEPAPAKELRLFGLARELERLYREAWDKNYRPYRKIMIRTAMLSTVGWLLFAIGFALAIAFVALRVGQGNGTPGGTILAVTLASQTNATLAGVRENVGWLASSLRMTMRYLWLIEYGETHAESLDATPRRPLRS